MFEANIRGIQVSANRKGVGGKCETNNIKQCGFYVRETPPQKKNKKKQTIIKKHLIAC